MPIYEYICSNCGSEFDKLMRFSDPDIDHPSCPSCRSQNTSKRLSIFASVSGSSSRGGNSSLNNSCGNSGGFR